MALTPTQLEQITAWCAASSELASLRRQAHRTFFGEDDARPLHYWPGAGDPTSRERRFLGWFLFSPLLPDQQRPAEYAASRLLQGAALADALQAIPQVRYLLAIVTSVVPGQGVYLELEDERFEVRSRQWAQTLVRGVAMVAHLVPQRRGVWIPGPGWLQWPIGIGPNMRQELKRFQLAPIELERIMQERTEPDKTARTTEYPKDATLEEAVARMTAAAAAVGRTGLLLSVTEWNDLILQHLSNPDITAFAREVVQRVGEVEGVQELDHWLALAMNIWNATPQPDRGGKTANKLLSGGPP